MRDEVVFSERGRDRKRETERDRERKDESWYSKSRVEQSSKQTTSNRPVTDPSLLKINNQ
jgi:hypothetical protein